MFDYLQKFNTLPVNLRESVSSPAAMAVISDLENKYKIDLAAIVMKVMVKIIPITDLSIYFVSDFSLSKETAQKLTTELKERLFFSAANYLGFNASYSSIIPKTAAAPVHLMAIEKLIKDTGITFAGVELNSRFKNILATYLKGVRSRIDTRITLNKNIASGGLGLDYKIIDKVFKLADELVASQMLPSGELISLPVNPEPVKSGLDKVRALYEKTGETRDIPYDLKAAISTGTIKKPAAPLNLPTPVEAREKLLEEPEDELRLAAAPIIVKSVEAVKPIKPVESEKTTVAPITIQSKELVKEPILTPVNIPINIPIAPVVKSVTPIIPVTSITPITPVIEAVKLATTIKPVAPIISPITVTPTVKTEPKINRPPERKEGIFSRLFHKNSLEKPVEIKKPIVAVKPIVTVPASIASLRTEAATVNKPVVPVVQKPAVEIKSAPKVMGPIEELRYLDLVNFRRLGSSPIEATEKVEAKIKLLEKDGYDRMVAGVLAWREGEINSIYLKMGQESLSKGIPFKQCADNYRLAKTPGFLFWEEIEAIIALNTSLMF
jgi:hypothetical protein